MKLCMSRREHEILGYHQENSALGSRGPGSLGAARPIYLDLIPRNTFKRRWIGTKYYMSHQKHEI
jgi:hypothetical protein